MKQKMYLQHSTKKEARYEILSFNQETKIAKLKGQYATLFEQPLTKERMEKYGYTIVKETISPEKA